MKIKHKEQILKAAREEQQTTNNTKGDSHKDNRRPFNRNSSDQKGMAAAAAAKSLQSCLTLCDPIDSSPPGSPILGILQARTLEWVAIFFSYA